MAKKKSLIDKAKTQCRARRNGPPTWWARLDDETRACIDELIDAWNAGDLFENFGSVSDLRNFVCEELGLSVRYDAFRRYVRIRNDG